MSESVRFDESQALEFTVLRGRGHFDGSRAECQRGSESTSVHLLHIGSYSSKAVPASWIPSTLHIK